MKKILKFLLVFLLVLSVSKSGILKYSKEYNVSRISLNSNNVNNKKELKNLVIFIEFSDSDDNVTHHLDDDESILNANTIYNSDEFEMITDKGVVKVPSFKSYYERESYGQLSITTEFFPKENGKVQSFRDNKPIGYYLRYSDANTIGYKDRDEANKREAELVEKAISYVNSQVADLGLSKSDIDSDGNGSIDAISFIIEGQENIPNTIGWQDLLWSHKSSNKGDILATILNASIDNYNFIYAGDYTQPIQLFSLDRGQYGTLIHEFGHTLGFRDLYRYGNGKENISEKPVGFFDIMGNAIGSNPQHFLAYFISEFSEETNWHTKLPVIDKSTNDITLYKPKFIDNSEMRAIKIQPDANSKEYFIVEYHEKHNTYDFSSVDKSGIIVYRVNDNNKYSGNSLGSAGNGNKDHIFVFRPGETKLGQAGGNLSEATLNMDRNTLGKTEITDGSFDNETIYYADGSNSRIKILVTDETDESVTFNVIMPNVMGTGIESDPYIINNKEDFLYLMGLGTSNKYYKLGKDIDFEGVEDYPKMTFLGHLDGNNKTIRNITAVGTGLFSSVGDYGVHSEIKDLKIENILVMPGSGDHLGGVTSVASNATFKNVHVLSGSITNKESISSLASTGGFAGNVSNDTYIDDCSSSVVVSAPKNVGGFIGLNMNATIKNCFSNGSVFGNVNIGGFIGLQCIMDNTYKQPQNVYYDYTKDASLKAVGGYGAFHNLNTLSAESLSIGIVGVSVLENIDLKVGETFNYQISTKPNSSITYKLQLEKSNIAELENNILKGKRAGNSKIFVDISIGTNLMRLSSDLTVKNLNILKGDVDLDGELTLYDVLFALRIALKIPEAIIKLTPEVIEAGNYNPDVDNEIDLGDVLYILREYLNQ